MLLLAERLKTLRKGRGLTQDELAKKLNVSQPTVGGWEAGRTEPDTDMQIKIADLFDVSIDYLLGRDNNFLNKIVTDDDFNKRLHRIMNDNNTKILIGKTENLTEREWQQLLKFIDYVIKEDGKK